MLVQRLQLLNQCAAAVAGGASVKRLPPALFLQIEPKKPTVAGDALVIPAVRPVSTIPAAHAAPFSSARRAGGVLVRATTHAAPRAASAIARITAASAGSATLGRAAIPTIRASRAAAHPMTHLGA